MKGNVRYVVAMIVIAAAGVGSIFLWHKGKPPETPQESPKDQTAAKPPATPGPRPLNIPSVNPPTTSAPSSRPATGNPIIDTQVLPSNGLTGDAAKSSYQKGTELFAAKKLIEARTELSKALASGKLAVGEEADAVKKLSDLANEIIFTRKFVDGDPYVLQYTVQPGETLEGVGGIERRLALRVPSQLVLRINHIQRAVDIQSGQTLKLFKGPFHAIVTKSRFTMDVYLDDAFVRRYRICIGAPESPTPVGFFHLTLRGKLTGNTPYTPPAGSGLPMRKIMPGEAGYPLDSGGHWISLTGIPEKGTDIPDSAGYGIHGTNDPSTIGKAASHGCIRLSDKDIEELFMLLYEKWSTVEVRP